MLLTAELEFAAARLAVLLQHFAEINIDRESRRAEAIRGHWGAEAYTGSSTSSSRTISPDTDRATEQKNVARSLVRLQDQRRIDFLSDLPDDISFKAQTDAKIKGLASQYYMSNARAATCWKRLGENRQSR